MFHGYRFKNNNIILDVNSGCVHLVDNVVFDVLMEYGESYKAAIYGAGEFNAPKQGADEESDETYSLSEITEAIEEIDELAKTGMLFAKDDQITEDMLTGRDKVIKALCLHVAHDCNLRCKYCFAGTGAFAGSRSLMDTETGKRAIDFLIQNSGERINLEVDFFGGEPLMNFEVVKDIVSYGEKASEVVGKKIRWTMTTNALLLDEVKANYLNETMDNIVLSIDGRPEIHNLMRPGTNGSGSYDPVIKNIKYMGGIRQGRYYLRGTFTKHNLDFANDVCHLADMGFQNISMEPVVTSPENEFAITKDDIPRVLSEYENLADTYLDFAKTGRRFAFFHFNIDPAQGPCLIKRVSGCGAGTEYVAVSPEGDIYPCHQFVGNEEFKLGNLHDRGADINREAGQVPKLMAENPQSNPAKAPIKFDNRLYDYFNEAHVYNKEACRNCWAKFYCSGGCHAGAYYSNGDILLPDELACTLERKRVELALGIWAVSKTL